MTDSLQGCGRARCSDCRYPQLRRVAVDTGRRRKAAGGVRQVRECRADLHATTTIDSLDRGCGDFGLSREHRG